MTMMDIGGRRPLLGLRHGWSVAVRSSNGRTLDLTVVVCVDEVLG